MADGLMRAIARLARRRDQLASKDSVTSEYETECWKIKKKTVSNRYFSRVVIKCRFKAANCSCMHCIVISFSFSVTFILVQQKLDGIHLWILDVGILLILIIVFLDSIVHWSIGHVHVQRSLLINFHYTLIPLQYSCLRVEQPIRIDWVLCKHHWECPINRKTTPMLFCII